MKKNTFALDLGSFNSVVTRWNFETDSPEILSLENIRRGGKLSQGIDNSNTIPTALFLVHPRDYLGRFAGWFFARSKRHTGARIGREAFDLDGGKFGRNFVSGFKRELGQNGYHILASLGDWSYTAEETAYLYIKELVKEVQGTVRQKVRDLVLTVPVDFYEIYRARLFRMLRFTGVRHLRTLDEPVAAAIGYGLSATHSRKILVVDFGAETLDLAFIRFDERSVESGHAEVLAKAGASIGGRLVDRWIVEDICKHYGYRFKQLLQDSTNIWWYRMLLDEARRVKEGLFTQDKQIFYLMPSAMMNVYRDPYASSQEKQPLDYHRADLLALLTNRGLYKQLEELLKEVSLKEEPEEVLLTGGSTLLPGIYPFMEEYFGRNRVRAWQPFYAVAFGAAAYAAGRVEKSDKITHDYAFLTYDRVTHEPRYHTVVKRGTSFPTKPHHWRRQLVPTCALGEPERFFKLELFEIGRQHSLESEYVWDEKGELHILNGQKEDQVVIPLNRDNLVMGYLNPPHLPSEKAPRIDLSFRVNEEKWLCATVKDLKTGKILFSDRPVIRVT